MSSEYRVNIIISTKDATSAEAKKAARGLEGLAQAAKLAAAALAVVKSVRIAVQLVKLGAESLATRDRLVAFAGGAARADEMLAALNRGTDNTVDRMTAMAQASRLIETGMAKSTREMELAGAIVAKLGNQTLSTESRMQSFTLLLSNQAVRRLDDFGMSVENIRRRQEALEAQGLSTEQAFKTAVYDEAAEKLGILGDQSDTLATQVAGATAGWNTFKQVVGESLGVIVDSTGVLKVAGDALNDIAKKTLLVNEATELQRQTGLSLRQAMAQVTRAHELNARALVQEEVATKDLTAAVLTLAEAEKIYAEHRKTQDRIFEDRIWLMERENKKRRETALLIQNLKEDRVELYAGLEDLERDHQDRIAAIIEAGTRKAIETRFALITEARQRELELLSSAIDERNWQATLEGMLKSHLDRLAAIQDQYRQSEQQKEDARHQAFLKQLTAEQQERLDALAKQYGKDASGKKTREELEEEHRRRMMGLYTKSARDAEEKRHAEALKELEYQEKLEELQETFNAEKEAAEEQHEQRLKKIAEQARLDAIERENQRYLDEVEAATKRRAQQQTDEAVRQAINQKYDALMQAEEERVQALQLAQQAAHMQAMLDAENASYLRRRTALQTELTGVENKLSGLGVKLDDLGTAMEKAAQDAKDAAWIFQQAFGTFGGPQITPYQYGGVHRGGLALVGERGPEVLNLPAGTRVTPTNKIGTTIYITNYFGAGSVRSDRDIRRIQHDQERSLRLHGMGVVA